MMGLTEGTTSAAMRPNSKDRQPRLALSNQVHTPLARLAAHRPIARVYIPYAACRTTVSNTAPGCGNYDAPLVLLLL